MKPQTAVRLVGEYARLTCAIKTCKREIGARLTKCNGLNGWRNELEPNGIFASDRSRSDQDTHLKGWYRPIDLVDDVVYLDIDQDQRDECEHCFAAHLLIQERKALRRQLASVKAAMTRHGAPHA